MSVEDLLKPRIVCTVDYMGNIFGVNQIINLTYNKTFNEYEYVDCSRQILLSHFLKYSQFKVLEWWENRQERDMPEYVKYNNEGHTNHCKVYKIVKKFENGFTLDNRDYSRYSYCNYLPATEQEYNTYLQSKT